MTYSGAVFWRGLEDLRWDRIYSSGNRGVKKGPGTSRNEGRGIPRAIPSLYVVVCWLWKGCVKSVNIFPLSTSVENRQTDCYSGGYFKVLSVS
jgi:hypothetical protein